MCLPAAAAVVLRYMYCGRTLDGGTQKFKSAFKDRPRVIVYSRLETGGMDDCVAAVTTAVAAYY